MNWLAELPLSETAAAVRRTLSPPMFADLQQSIEHLSLITERPIQEVAERLLCSVQAMADGDGPDTFLDLLEDIIEENGGV